jgi:hypothetical protein
MELKTMNSMKLSDFTFNDVLDGLILAGYFYLAVVLAVACGGQP